MVRSNKQNIPCYLTGFAAMAVSLLFFLVHRAELVVLLASAFFLVICATDTLFSRIPNLCSLALLLAGLLHNFYLSGPFGLLSSVLGFLTGLCLLLLPYLLGGMGGGDVKALAALGALVGPSAVFQVFLYAALFGGGLSLIHYAFACDLRKITSKWLCALRVFVMTRDVGCLRPSTSEKVRCPYAVAIAFGFFAYVHWGRIV